MDFLSFEELSQFFSSAQTVSLKEQFPVYLTRTGQTDITSAEYLPDETGYPDTTTVELHFLLSDDSTLPVFYDTMTGAFSFGEERTVLGTSGQTYEKPVVDTLPSVSSSEVEQRQEGGYADVTAPESSARIPGQKKRELRKAELPKMLRIRTEHPGRRGGAAMSNPDEQRTSFIPPNFIEKGKILNGTFDIRNAIEAIIFALLIGVPVVHLPFSLTTRIIILCMTALPAAMVSLIGIGGESITAFLMNALRF